MVLGQSDAVLGPREDRRVGVTRDLDRHRSCGHLVRVRRVVSYHADLKGELERVLAVIYQNTIIWQHSDLHYLT